MKCKLKYKIVLMGGRELDTFVKLFHSVDFQNRINFKDSMEDSEEYKIIYNLLDGDQCGPWNVVYNECTDLVYKLFDNQVRSIDQFVEEIIEIIIHNSYSSIYSECIKYFGDNILDYLALDIIIPLIIFIRDRIPVQPCSLRALILSDDGYEKTNQYNKISEPMEMLPNIIKEVFCINKDEFSGHYNISTHYPELLSAIINKIKISNCIDTNAYEIQENSDIIKYEKSPKRKKTTISFVFNKRFLESCINDIKNGVNDDKSISKIIEEYYILERLFNLHARIDIITSIINSRAKGITRDRLIKYANNVQYMPNIFNRLKFYHQIEKEIISDHDGTEKLIGNIMTLANTLIPLIQKAMYLYLMNRDLKGMDTETFYYDMINEIYKSKIYNTYCNVDIPEKFCNYEPTDREMRKYSDMAEAWDMIEVYSIKHEYETNWW